jgi:hypothetical protein
MIISVTSVANSLYTFENWFKQIFSMGNTEMRTMLDNRSRIDGRRGCCCKGLCMACCRGRRKETDLRE